MSVLPIYDGVPWSPFFVFIKKTGFNHRELLELLGRQAYTETDKIDLSHDYLCIGECHNWTHIADDYGYTHWHSESFRSRLASLAHAYDLFSFSVGEDDMSFDFELHLNGHLVRRLVWSDPTYDGGYLKEQFGDPIKGEEHIPKGSDPIKGLWQVASSLEIEADYTKLHLKAYGPVVPQKKPLGWLRSAFGMNDKDK